LWKKKVTITVRVEGPGTATVNGETAVTVAEGEALTFEATPAEGATFIGWDISPLPSTAEADGIYTAIFILIQNWTVTFDLDGGTGTFADQIITDGEKAAEPLDKPIKEGYTFEGWRFDFNQAINSDVTVKALWKKAYTITVKVEGKGTATVNGEISVTVEEGTELKFYGIPAAGYVFDHWNTILPTTATESATYTATFIELR
jgi:hypothetical protein